MFQIAHVNSVLSIAVIFFETSNTMLFKQHEDAVLQNLFCQSYGLVVLTKGIPEKVMLVERKIPYCIQNLLLKKIRSCDFKVNISNSDDTDSNFSEEFRKDWYRYIRLTISKILANCKKETHLYDDADFERYENGLVFEDQFDFPHGQMSTKTKKILKNYIYETYKFPACSFNDTTVDIKTDRNENDDYEDELFKSPTCKFLKKLAEFLTAFIEFEEETGYTFRFDLKTILKLKTFHIQFTGLDGYEYIQNFFILQVDKLNKLVRNPQRCNNYTFNSNTEYASLKSKNNILNIKRRKKLVFREIDRQTYKARLVNVDEVVKLLWNQQKELGKWDFKHILPKCLTLKNLNEPEEESKFEQKEEDELETLAEDMFLDLTKRIDPDVFYRCVKRIKWREK